MSVASNSPLPCATANVTAINARAATSPAIARRRSSRTPTAYRTSTKKISGVTAVCSETPPRAATSCDVNPMTRAARGAAPPEHQRGAHHGESDGCEPSRLEPLVPDLELDRCDEPGGDRHVSGTDATAQAHALTLARLRRPCIEPGTERSPPTGGDERPRRSSSGKTRNTTVRRCTPSRSVLPSGHNLTRRQT